MPTAAVFVAEVGEAPHVAHADGERQRRHDEVEFARPRAALLVLRHVVVTARGAAAARQELTRRFFL